jgi:ATP-dependent helicase HrpA
MPSRKPCFESQIVQHCYSADRAKLLRSLKKFKRSDDDKVQKRQLLDAIQQSIDKVRRRRQQKPASRLDNSLPFYDHRDELAEAISNHQVVIVCGETGSGKTTQLPQLCLDLGLADAGMIGHTQPRRIAAQTVSSRIAGELRTQVGEAVGYKIRFSDRSNPSGFIKLMTDGILLAEIQNDHWLNTYSTIIIDEAHERSLNIDLLLGYLKHILPRRPDLKLIVTSATIDPQKFSDYFSDAPILNISGRTYPVEIRYRPLAAHERDRDLQQALVEAIDELKQVAVEDVLVFFASERQIREASEKLSKRFQREYDVLPLYGRLSHDQQQKIFQRHTKRRIVLATNVAETSITVPGIRYVIDTGLVRLSRYSWRSRIQRLPIEKTSQASANQRSGRCGRLAPGICIRLYDEDDFNNRPEFTEPEILRTNLASVILQMNLLKLGSIQAFDFVDSPDSRLINDGFRLLFELRASDEKDRILELGRQIANLPVDPRLAAMLIRAQQLDCLSEMLVITSALSIQDPRYSQEENRQAAQEKHRIWHHQNSDFMFWLNLWQDLQQQKSELSRNQFSRWCAKHYLSYMRVREWQDIYQQLRQQLRELKTRFNPAQAEDDTIHRCIFAGIPSHIASFDGEKQFIATRNRQVVIFPGSDLAKQTPKWIMAFAMIETARLYAHGVARFNPQWAMHDAIHLHQYEYYEPHWQARQGRVAAYRNTRIYGLLIEGGKRVNFAAIDAKQSREIFIQRALVEGDYQTNIEVIKSNRKLIDYYQHQEDKQRRRDILISDRQLYEFYDEKLPPQAVDAPSFESWLKRQPQKLIDKFRLAKENLVDEEVGEDSAADFPAEIQLRDQTLKLDYVFDPGNEFDGVTVRIPLLLLNQFNDADFDWLVPGLVKQKIEVLIRSLPRMLRKNFIPVGEFTEACFQRINSEGNFYRELQQALYQMTGVQIAPDDWQPDAIDRHLNMHYWLEDKGNCIAQSNNLLALQEQYGEQANTIFEQEIQHDESIARSGLIDWDFEQWESRVVIGKNGQQVSAYPALVDYQESVSIELFETKGDARFYHATGIARLIYLRQMPTVKYLRKNLPKIDATALMYSSMASKSELVEDIIMTAVFSCFLHAGLPASREAFNDCIARNESRFIECANQIGELAHQILTSYRAVTGILDEAPIPPDHIQDIYQQCEYLVYQGFLRHMTIESLSRAPAYFQAMQKRLQNYKSASGRINTNLDTVRKFWNQYLALSDNEKNNADKLNELRWMIEEFRIACFAQPMKTRIPVSEKKLEKLIASIKATTTL